MSRWIYFRNAGEFSRFSLSTLMQNEPKNNLLLGTLAYLQQNPKAKAAQPLLLAAQADAQGFAVLIKERPLLLTDVAPEALEELALFLNANNLKPKEFIAPRPTAHLFSKYWMKPVSERKDLHLYLSTDGSPINLAPGKMRRAWLQEKDLVADWMAQSATESNKGESIEKSGQLSQDLISNQRLFVWCDNEIPVAMAAFTGETTNGVRIILVYTRLENRNCGYARSLTWSLSELQRQRGKKFCVLFVEADNKIANKMYKQIGYKPLTDFTHLQF